MDADDLAWATVTPKTCRKHVWHMGRCLYCLKPYDEAVSRRARNNRARGNAIEREVGKALGLRRVGQFGGPDDLGSFNEPFVVQVKSGLSFPERIDRWLKALPANAGQTPLVVVTD